MGCRCSSYHSNLEIEADLNESLSDIIRTQAREYPVLIYSQLDCGPSSQSKELLKKNHIEFEYFELDHMSESDQVLRILQNMTGQKSTPYVFMNSRYLGGLAELRSAIEFNAKYNPA